MKRTGSVEADQDSPRGFRGGSKGRSGLPNVPEIGPGRRLSRRAGSMGETIAESGDLWKSTDSRGSNESIASNASIPLPVPVPVPTPVTYAAIGVVVMGGGAGVGHRGGPPIHSC